MSPRPLRVLHVFGAMDRGGAELRTLDVMRRLPSDQVRLEFATLSGRAGTLAGEIDQLGGAVHPCRLDPGFPLRFAALLRRREIDVVHSHVQLFSGFVLTVARATGIGGRIAHFRSTADDRGNSPARRVYRATMRQLLARSATDILGVSEGVMSEAWSPGWSRDPRCRVVYNGLDVTQFDTGDARADVRGELGIPPTAPLILQVGRFDPPKHQRKAVEVMAALATRSPAHLVFAGRDATPLGREAQQRATALGLRDRIHFLGERADIPRLVCAADVALSTSIREGLPGAVLEAAAAGTPVVSSDLPGAREIAAVLPGIQLYPIDEPDPTWADALLGALARSPTPAERRDARARFATSRFSIEACTRDLLDVWTRGR